MELHLKKFFELFREKIIKKSLFQRKNGEHFYIIRKKIKGS